MRHAVYEVPRDAAPRAEPFLALNDYEILCDASGDGAILSEKEWAPLKLSRHFDIWRCPRNAQTN